MTESRLFDCNNGYSKWEDTWSEYKKTWCCKFRQMGCTALTTTSVTTITSVTTATSITMTESRLFDCNNGYSKWEDTWSEYKKTWCCKFRQMGCTVPTTTSITTTENRPFDCN